MSPRGAEVAAEPGAAAGPVSGSPRPLFGGCWSCRLLSGAGLLMAAVWVYERPRSIMRQGIPPSMGAIAQIAFAAGEGRGRGARGARGGPEIAQKLRGACAGPGGGC
ncbi:DMAC1 protein, partial [Spelaeornis formosus]|nr:DMAC1 protein [Elachura formosa]